MSGSCDSLNLAVATSVILYEIAYGCVRREV
jgi:tRNA G18 (ribose-2'-O)-methylase SpoU